MENGLATVFILLLLFVLSSFSFLHFHKVFMKGKEMLFCADISFNVSISIIFQIRSGQIDYLLLKYMCKDFKKHPQIAYMAKWRDLLGKLFFHTNELAHIYIERRYSLTPKQHEGDSQSWANPTLLTLTPSHQDILN